MPRHARPHRGALLGAIAAVVAVGCGPTYYTLSIERARSAMQRADADHAEFYAPYEYHHAQARLHKATEEAAESSYEDAIRFARESERYSERAIERSRAEREGEARSPAAAQRAGQRVGQRAGRRAGQRAGQRQCAPRETALAEAHADFARSERSQGDARRAGDHRQESEAYRGAARHLSPQARCAPEGPANASGIRSVPVAATEERDPSAASR